MWRPIDSAKHDDDEILIKTKLGIVSAWWHSDASEWVCYDDAFTVPETSDIVWMELPDSPVKTIVRNANET